MISVILPYFNAEATLKTAIESLINQTYENFELILCNDGSTDESEKIAKSFAKDKRIKLIQQKNQGVARAHSFAMEHASGEYIARMDADDFAHPARFKLQHQHLTNDSNLQVSASQVEFNSCLDKADGFQHFVNWNNTLLTYEEILENRFIEMPLVNPSTMIRRELYESIGTYQNNSFPEDYDYWLKALSSGAKIEKLPHKLITWNDSSSRLTRSSLLYDPENFYACKAYYLAQELQKNNIDEVVIWGAGNKSRKRSDELLKYGITIKAYIDVSKKLIDREINGVPIYDFQDTQKFQNEFILSYVGNRGIRGKIKRYLEKLDLRAQKNFILCS